VLTYEIRLSMAGDTCPLGTFTSTTGTAECMPCTTPGYIPTGDPPTNCAACPDGKTALPYDSECRAKSSALLAPPPLFFLSYS